MEILAAYVTCVGIGIALCLSIQKWTKVVASRASNGEAAA
jgi:hypothetical protein